MARYIDADAMKDGIIKLRRTLDTGKCSNDFACGWVIGVDNMEGLIDRQPTADVVEVKHGKWIKVGKTRCNSNILKCSVCGTVRQGVAYTKYCRDCGAKMDE